MPVVLIERSVMHGLSNLRSTTDFVLPVKSVIDISGLIVRKEEDITAINPRNEVLFGFSVWRVRWKSSRNFNHHSWP